MELRAFRCGVNIVAYEKGGKKYGMSCAWATMIDYGTVGMLLGSESVTGNNLEVNDMVGISCLSKGQENIALIFGSSHSDLENKFKNGKYIVKNHAILMENAKLTMFCRVKKIVKLLDDSDDNFILFEVISFDYDKNKEYLSLEEALPEE